MAVESYLVGVTGFLLFVVLYIAQQRLGWSVGWFAKEILLGFLVYLLSIVAGFLWVKEFSYWYCTSIYSFLWFFFFFVSSIYSVSVSLGIITYLYQQPGKTATVTKIHEQCILAEFRKRVEFLILTKQVQNVERGYIATPTGKQTVRRLRLIHRLLGMKSHGFYSATPRQAEIKET